MANVLSSDIAHFDLAHLALLAAIAVSLLIARALRHYKCRRPPQALSQIPTLEDIPSLAAEDLVRELAHEIAELRSPSRSGRYIREHVKVVVLEYESERCLDREG